MSGGVNTAALVFLHTGEVPGLVAGMHGGRLVVHELGPRGPGGRTVLGAVHRVLAALQVRLADMEGVLVTTGPGTLAGLLRPVSSSYDQGTLRLTAEALRTGATHGAFELYIDGVSAGPVPVHAIEIVEALADDDKQINAASESRPTTSTWRSSSSWVRRSPCCWHRRKA